MIDNKITIKDDEKVNIQRGAIGHRSTWTGLTYKYAAEAGKAEEAEKIIRQAISETGRVQGNALREQCPDPTSCKSFCDTMFTPTLLFRKGQSDDRRRIPDPTVQRLRRVFPPV